MRYHDTDGRMHKEYDAVVHAWGISRSETEALCCTTVHYDSPKHAADELDKLIEKYFIEKGDMGYVNGVN